LKSMRRTVSLPSTNLAEPLQTIFVSLWKDRKLQGEVSSNNSFVDSIANIDFLYVIVLGVLLGAAELMGRYRDDPGSVFRAPPAWIYRVRPVSPT